MSHEQSRSKILEKVNVYDNVKKPQTLKYRPIKMCKTYTQKTNWEKLKKKKIVEFTNTLGDPLL